MSLDDLVKASLLKAHTPTRDQIAKIFGVVDRDLQDSKRNLSPDGQLQVNAESQVNRGSKFSV